MLQVGKLGSTICLPFDEFEAVDMPLHGPGTVGQRESREDRRFVPLDAASKGEEFSDARRTHIFEPALKSLTTVVANEMQEFVGQLSRLREDIIHLRDSIQLRLGRWAQRLWTGHHPPDELPWGHVLEERVRN